MVKFVLVFLRYYTKRQFLTVIFKLEFPISWPGIPANELMIDLEKKKSLL